MGITEILLVVFGILAFIVSFIIPEGIENKGSQEIVIPEEKLYKLIEGRINKAKFDIEQKTEETIVAATEKAERSMERLSNEKIMAIDEFSHLVLDKINKNHEEAVFLYDMLNNKHVQLKNTMADINKNVENVKTELKVTKELQVNQNYSDINQTEDKENCQDLNRSKKKRRNKQRSSITNDKVIGANYHPNNKIEKTNGKDISIDNTIYVGEEADKKGVKKTEVEEKLTLINADESIKLYHSDEDFSNNRNKEMIIQLYDEGMSVVEIAKKLGMGVGEVKLILDLSINMSE